MNNIKIHPLVTTVTFLVLAMATAWLAITMAQPSIELLKNGVRAEATVVEVVEVHRTDFDGFSPVVVFADKLGVQHRIQCKFSTGQPTWRKGDKLEIIYLPDRPEDAQTTHWWDLWGFALIPFVASILLLLISAVAFWRSISNRKTTMNNELGA